MNNDILFLTLIGVSTLIIVSIWVKCVVLTGTIYEDIVTNENRINKYTDIAVTNRDFFNISNI